MTGTAVVATAGTGEVAVDRSVEMGDYLKRLASPNGLAQQKQLMTAYDAACHALIGENDIQKSGGKEFKKKSAWRKLARHFEISTQFISGSGAWNDEGHYVARVIIRAVAPWGQYADGVASCSTREGGKQKPEHDCLATAATRAANRAISDLIAMGEVSAEEVEGEDARRRPIPRREGKAVPVASGYGDEAKDATPEQMTELVHLTTDERLTPQERSSLAGKLEGGGFQTFAAAQRAIDHAKQRITARPA